MKTTESSSMSSSSSSFLNTEMDFSEIVLLFLLLFLFVLFPCDIVFVFRLFLVI